MAEQRAAILVRLDNSLKARLSEQAKRNDRTLQGEVSRIIRESVERNLSEHLEQSQL